jgi:hypothetical protein
MTPFARFMLIATACAAMLAIAGGLLLAHGLAHGELMTVELREPGHAGRFGLRLPVPAGLVAGALDLAAIAGSGEECQLRHFARSRAAWRAWRPAARAACRALAAGGDGTLVDVAGGPGTVRVVKRGDTVEIRVHGPGGDVRVTTPAALVRHLAGVI